MIKAAILLTVTVWVIVFVGMIVQHHKQPEPDVVSIPPAPVSLFDNTHDAATFATNNTQGGGTATFINCRLDYETADRIMQKYKNYNVIFQGCEIEWGQTGVRAMPQFSEVGAGTIEFHRAVSPEIVSGPDGLALERKTPSDEKP